MTAKACPVVTQDGAVLMFRHPLAGTQFVKGTIEAGETPRLAALRELQEEAGVLAESCDATPVISEEIAPQQLWYFVATTTNRLPEFWTHNCGDDGGHCFEFFWQDPTMPLPSDCAQKFQRAFDVMLAKGLLS